MVLHFVIWYYYIMVLLFYGIPLPWFYGITLPWFYGITLVFYGTYHIFHGVFHGVDTFFIYSSGARRGKAPTSTVCSWKAEGGTFNKG